MAPAQKTEERTIQFARAYTDDPCCLELILFLGRHPYARFSQLALAGSLGTRETHIEGALKRLISEGVVTRFEENSVSLYSLTRSEALHNLVTSLVEPETQRWCLTLRQLTPEPVQVFPL